VSGSNRTRWLTFIGRGGGVVMAPAVRTHQMTLLLGMGFEWYERAMKLPDTPRVPDGSYYEFMSPEVKAPQ